MEHTACSAGINLSKNSVTVVIQEHGVCQSPGLWPVGSDLHTEDPRPSL